MDTPEDQSWDKSDPNVVGNRDVYQKEGSLRPENSNKIILVDEGGPRESSAAYIMDLAIKKWKWPFRGDENDKRKYSHQQVIKYIEI